MILIGEKLNSSIPSVFRAFQENNADFVITAAKQQIEGGADYLDVNTAACMKDEPEKLKWVIETILNVENGAKFMLDSPNAKAVEYVLGSRPLGDVIINSITLENERFNAMLPLVLKYNTRIVALPIDDDCGMPETADKRFEIARVLIERLRESGVKDDDIFADALITTLGTNSESGVETLKTIRMLRENYPNIHITGGLSNVSFGLPGRTFIDSAFLTAAITCGLDSVIMNTIKPELRLALRAAMLVNGTDEYCLNFIESYRENNKTRG